MGRKYSSRQQQSLTGGFVINRVSAFDRSGKSGSAAGDVNGDGFDDLIVGAPTDDPNGTDSGASFVVFGGNFSGAATQAFPIWGSSREDRARERGSSSIFCPRRAAIREVQVIIEAWRRHYNTRRPRSALGYRPPALEAIIAMDRRPVMN